MDRVTEDYWAARRTANRWARIALQNKREGLPWKRAAQQAHEAIRWAILIIS